jgi:hypothetical protein
MRKFGEIETIQKLRRCLTRPAIGQGALSAEAVALRRTLLPYADPRRAAACERKRKRQD